MGAELRPESAGHAAQVPTAARAVQTEHGWGFKFLKACIHSNSKAKGDATSIQTSQSCTQCPLNEEGN